MSDAGKAVFLSYASQDAAAVERIAEALRAAGVEVWFDRNELVGGDAWDAKIRKQIAECALFVPVISASTQARREGYFRIEWRLAAQRTHAMADGTPFLLPVVIDDTGDAVALVPAEFKAVQWMRLPPSAFAKPAADTSPGLRTTGRPAGYGGQAHPGGAADQAQVHDGALEAFSVRVKKLLDRDAAEGSVAGPAAAARGSAQAGEGAAVSPRRESGQARPWWKRYAVIVGVSIGLIYAVKSVVMPRRAGAEKPASAARPEPAAPVSAAAAPGASSALGDVLAKVRRLRVKIDVTRAELEAATSLLELADRQHPNQPDIWAEWSLVDARFVDEMLDSSDARRDAMRQRAQRAYGLAPEAPAARLAQAQALTILNRGDAAALAQAKTLLEPLAARPDVDPGALLLLSSVSRERTNPEASFRYLDRLAQLPGGAVQAHMARGIALVFAERWAEAEVEIDRGLALERAGMLHMWKSYIQAMWHGNMPGAQRSVAAVPATFLQEDFPAAACFWVHLWSKDWDKALAVMRAVPRDYIDSGALSGPTAYFRGWVLARAGKRAAAEIELRVALDVVEARLKAKPNARSLLVAKALVLVSLGQREQAASLLRTVGQLYGEAPETWMDNFLTAELLPVEEAIRALAKQAETSAFTTTARLRIDPYLDRLRGHPDFAALQARAEADPRLSPAAHARAGVAKAAAPRADAMPAPAPEKSVAVLAFDNRSDDKVAEYLGEGISVDLITALQRVPGLVVRGSTSAFFFKGKNATAREIGEKLAVTYLLRGSVQQSGGQVRITAQLTRAATDEIVWACDPITKDLKAVFAIQDEIVALIAKNLSLQLGSSSTPKREVDPEAYRLLLEGRHHWSLRSEDSFARAESLLQRALELDEGWAMIHEALADLWVIRALYRGLLGEPFEEYRRKGQAAARRALQLDPTRAQPHASLGLAHTLVQSGPDWAGAERELRRAIDLAPNNATAHNWLGDVLLEQGRLDLAIAEYRRAEQLDPLALYVLSDLGWKLVNAQRFDEALRVLDRADALFPGRVRIVMQRAEALAGVGRPEEARAVVRAAIPALRSGADIYRSAEAVYFMKRLGFGAEAEAIAQTLLEQHPRNKFLRGAIFVGAGRREEGFALLEELPAFANRFLFYDPQFDSVRGDPRWTQLMEKRACAPEFQSARDSLVRLIKEAKK